MIHFKIPNNKTVGDFCFNYNWIICHFFSDPNIYFKIQHPCNLPVLLVFYSKNSHVKCTATSIVGNIFLSTFTNNL